MAGYNTQIKHKGSLFHIQTQDKGKGFNYVESTIYKSGRVLTSKRTLYTPYLSHSDLEQKIKSIIEKQHHAVLDEIHGGKFDNF